MDVQSCQPKNKLVGFWTRKLNVSNIFRQPIRCQRKQGAEQRKQGAEQRKRGAEQIKCTLRPPYKFSAECIVFLYKRVWYGAALW